MKNIKLKSPVFWLGLVSAVYTAVVHAGVTAGAKIPWWIGAIGVGMSTAMLYCTGKLHSNDKTDT